MPQMSMRSDRVQKRIHTTTSSFRAIFQEIDGTNILIVLGDEPVSQVHPRGARSYPPGAVFVPNRELTRITAGNALTYMAYPHGLYEAFRGGSHTVRHSGTVPANIPGEIQELEADVTTARSYVGTLLASGLLTAEEERALRLAQSHLVKSYGAKRNEHKTTARAQFVRGLQLKDALGRRNPMAAAFVNGAAIGHLLSRQSEVRHISAAVDRRTIHLYGAIEAHMELYRSLRAELKPRRMGNNGSRTLPGMLELLTEPNRGAGALKRTEQILRDFSQAFALVQALPFRRNAVRTGRDLAAAARCAREGNATELPPRFQKLRRAIAWTFAQHVLEHEIIAPLSFLIEDVRARDRSARKRNGEGRRGAAPIRKAMAPDRFARIEDALETFNGKLALCSDHGFEAPLKADVSRNIEVARAAMTADDWLKAKEALKAASALL